MMMLMMMMMMMMIPTCPLLVMKTMLRFLQYDPNN